MDDPDLEKYPLFPRADRYETELQPGDVLFIPGDPKFRDKSLTSSILGNDPKFRDKSLTSSILGNHPKFRDKSLTSSILGNDPKFRDNH